MTMSIFFRGGNNLKLIISEKPSVGKNIADAVGAKKREDGYIEGGGYVITWAFGHLLQLLDAKDYDEKYAKWEMANFPFIPDKFRYKVKTNPKNRDKADPGAKKQLGIIKKLSERSDIHTIVSACDFDREGQIIGDSIIAYLNTKKPVERLLLNEWTPDEVNRGLSKLKMNSEMKPVSDAGFARQKIDWTIGINLTTVATLKYRSSLGNRKGPLNVGRVLLPTLKIIYDRDKEIEKFKSKDFYRLNATFTSGENDFNAAYSEDGEDKFEDNKSLLEVKKLATGKRGKIVELTTEKKKDYPPYLFNLSNLQGHITSKFSGFTSDKVLKIAQSLYEKKHITYPRTASSALEESLVDRAEKVLNTLKKGHKHESKINFFKSKRVFNNKKVEGHSAIIPTYMVPKDGVLTKDEEIVYREICDRFIVQFMPVMEYEETIAKIEIDGIKGVFTAKGKVIIENGYKDLLKTETKEETLPALTKDEMVDATGIDISKGKTKPPAFHNEKTLLRVMETCGKQFSDEDDAEDEELMSAVLTGFSIGTPATRADTIKKLKTAGYINTKGKSLTCTPLGATLVESFPVSELFDLDYTGRLEKTLSEMEKGKVKSNELLTLINDFVVDAVKKIKESGGIKVENMNDREVLGTCPECGEQIVENGKAFGCSGYKEGCKFAVWKNDRFLAAMQKTPTKTMVKTLLKDGEVLVKDMVSKKGNKFDAILSLNKNPENGYYNWDMKFPEK